MAWTTTMPLQLRYIINDVGDVNVPQRYTDSRLQTALLVGAQFVGNELNFSQPFEPDLNALTLNPDPTLPPQDYSFVNLTVMRTAVIILTAEWQGSTSQAFSFKEFQSSADLRSISLAKKGLADAIYGMYEQQRMQYQLGVRLSAAAICSTINIWGCGWRGQIMLYSDRSLPFMY